MSKRFIDTDLWSKDWFMELTPAEKLAWVYLTTQCDNVGVWKPNFRLAEFIIGTQLDWEKFAGKTDGNIDILENGKWFLPDFCGFQYGELHEGCKPHRSYLKQLEKHGLLQRVSKGYAKGMGTLQEKEKEKELEEEKEEAGKSKTQAGKVKHPRLGCPMTQGWYDRIVSEWGEAIADRYIERVMAWDSGGGHGTKDFAARAHTFISRDVDAGKLAKREVSERPKTLKEQAREAFGEEYHGE